MLTDEVVMITFTAHRYVDPRNVLGAFIQADGSVAAATRRRQVCGLDRA
jgi:hypothetical protein